MTAATIDDRMTTNAPAITGSISALILALFYRLPGKDVAVMVQVNKGDLSREAAEGMLSKAY